MSFWLTGRDKSCRNT